MTSGVVPKVGQRAAFFGGFVTTGVGEKEKDEMSVSGVPDEDTLREIEARAEAATEGPWEIFRYRHGGGRIHISGDDGRDRALIADMDGEPENVATVYNEGDREFLLAARSDVPMLVEAVRLQQREIERLSGALDMLADKHEDAFKAGAAGTADSVDWWRSYSDDIASGLRRMTEERDALAAVITRVRERAEEWSRLDQRGWSGHVTAGRELLALLPVPDSEEETDRG